MGKRIAFTGAANAKPARMYDEPDLFVTEATPGSAPRNLTTGYDYDVEGGIGSDQHPPRAGSDGGVIWARDGKSIVVVTSENGRANLKRFSTSDGKVDFRDDRQSRGDLLHRELRWIEAGDARFDAGEHR